MSRSFNVSAILFSVLLVAVLAVGGSCKTPPAHQGGRPPFAVRVEGQVRKPGEYTVTEGTTIRSAIRRAGGVCEHPGVFKPGVATVMLPDGSSRRVPREQWSAFTLHEGDRVTVERRYL